MEFVVLSNETFNFFLLQYAVFFVPLFIYISALSFVKE